MREKDIPLAKELHEKLRSFSSDIITLPGIAARPDLKCLVAQLVDSIRRIKYVQVIKDKPISVSCIQPQLSFFDPLRAASYQRRVGNINEAFWLVFLLTHFGKNRRTGWSLVKNIYAGDGQTWTWNRICTNFNVFREWLHQNNDALKATGNFGNHRKYQSLDSYSLVGTGNAIGSYIEWVGPAFDHPTLIAETISRVGNDSYVLFDGLYQSLGQVISFGRTAKFDYLTMVGKLGLAPIAPRFTYMNGATGPKKGAKLLFRGNINASISESELNEMLTLLDRHLDLFFGMQVLEDALCNWQKSPDNYIYFSG